MECSSPINTLKSLFSRKSEREIQLNELAELQSKIKTFSTFSRVDFGPELISIPFSST